MLFTKISFIDALREWRRQYSGKRLGYIVCDGTHWDLEVEYNNGKKPVRLVVNAYPYNFTKFELLFGGFKL